MKYTCMWHHTAWWVFSAVWFSLTVSINFWKFHVTYNKWICKLASVSSQSDCGLIHAQQCWTILLTTLNNVGSTTFFKAVFIDPEQVVCFYACIYAYYITCSRISQDRSRLMNSTKEVTNICYVIFTRRPCMEWNFVTYRHIKETLCRKFDRFSRFSYNIYNIHLHLVLKQIQTHSYVQVFDYIAMSMEHIFRPNSWSTVQESSNMHEILARLNSTLQFSSIWCSS